ncbi:MAG TPA: hypothetical protein VIV64_01505 [Gammaproteobacteria bacterium]|jgi:hypothetical protein
MSKYVKLAEETGDRYLAALAQGQENFLNYVAAMNRWTPRPAGAMAGMSAWRAFANASFEFSERCLQQQKAFSDQFLGQAGKPAKASARTRTSSAAKSSATANAPAVTSSKKKASTRSKPAPAAS